MIDVLHRIKNIHGQCCVTVLLNTHRTIPDNEKDPIVLKNLVKSAQARLRSECDPETADVVSKKLLALAEAIDHRQNLESLVLFVSQDISEYIRLPLHVEERVVLDDTFATRDLLRALYEEKEYYLLVLSREKARLIEAFNDKVVSEWDEVFPIENEFLHPRQRAEAAVANRQTHLQQEFFNIVDKKLSDVLQGRAGRVLICTEESNYHEYLKVADRKDLIMGVLSGNRTGEKAHHIVAAAWPVALQIRKDSIAQRVQQLEKAAGAGRVLTDFNDIWKAVNEGRGETLFVRKGYFQPARLSHGVVEIVPDAERELPGVVDDIIDEMIEINLKNGGDSVFLTGDALEKYQGLALATRY